MKNFSVSVSFNFDPQVKLDIAETGDLETLLQYRRNPVLTWKYLTHIFFWAATDGKDWKDS